MRIQPVFNWALLISLFFTIFCLKTAVTASIFVHDNCLPDTCVNSETDNFFSYGACCDNECCDRLRYWVYPATIAGVGFVAGAFFALCFQCR